MNSSVDGKPEPEETEEDWPDLFEKIKGNTKAFDYTDADLYELALFEGDKRFGSKCEHEKTKRGRCLNCLRKVVTK